MRELPFPDASFDLAFCISTLEHIGFDNAIYGGAAAHDEGGPADALGELRRVVGGRVLVSVPTGAHEDHGWHLQRTPQEWSALFEASGFLVYEDEVYLLTDDGWRSASIAEVEGAHYGDGRATAVLLAELRPARLREKVRLSARDVLHRGEPRRVHP
ncbi:MAG: methyltransferase domain-containing protein [Actinobacteria bacterium]|nr:methyltransferase domain-containing protein [Actinomycetota bacterium]